MERIQCKLNHMKRRKVMEANAAGMFDWHLGLARQQAGGHGRTDPFSPKTGWACWVGWGGAGLGLRGGGRGGPPPWECPVCTRDEQVTRELNPHKVNRTARHWGSTAQATEAAGASSPGAVRSHAFTIGTKLKKNMRDLTSRWIQ